MFREAATIALKLAIATHDLQRGLTNRFLTSPQGSEPILRFSRGKICLLNVFLRAGVEILIFVCVCAQDADLHVIQIKYQLKLRKLALYSYGYSVRALNTKPDHLVIANRVL